jgi:hypothetical protein
MLKKLRTVIYHAADLAAAKEWYSKATGLQPYFDEPFYRNAPNNSALLILRSCLN